MNDELNRILKSMDLPVMRLNTESAANCRWLLSNMGIRNSKHPKYEIAKKLLKEIVHKKQETPASGQQPGS